MKIEDGGPAFPLEQGTQDHYQREPGMSLRDYFAGQAIVGFMANPDLLASVSGEMLKAGLETTEMPRVIAEQVYQLADAMLKAREQ